MLNQMIARTCFDLFLFLCKITGMPVTVKLTTTDARAWRANKPQWVSAEGEVLRAVTPEEEKAMFPAIQRAKAMGQDGMAHVEAEYRVANGIDGQISIQKMPIELVFRVTRTGREQKDFLLDVFWGGNRYVQGREIIEKRILAKFGECSLKSPNGKTIKVIRDPNINRPTFAESQRSAPAPERCSCHGFKDNPDPTRHHIACQWNALAPPNERAIPVNIPQPPSMIAYEGPISGLAFDPRTVPSARVVQERQQAAAAPAARTVQAIPGMPGRAPQPNPMVAPVYALPQRHAGVSGGGGVTVAQTPVPLGAEAPVTLVPPLVSPNECVNDCRGVLSGTAGWAWPAGKRPIEGQHHPMCEYAPAWEAATTDKKSYMLYDLESHVEIRPATTDEVAKAEVEFDRSGVMAVAIAGRYYAVVEQGGRPKVRKVARGVTTGDVLPQLARTQAPAQPALRQTPGVRTVAAPPAMPGRPAPLMAPAPRPTPIVAPPTAVPAMAAPAQPAEPSIEELEAMLARRRAALTASAPAPSAEPDMEVGSEGLSADLGGDLGGELGGDMNDEETDVPTEPGIAPPLFVPPVPPVSEESLRDANGLVGHQQLTDDIPPGPVLLSEPQPFVDPLQAGLEHGHVAQL